MLDCNTTKAIFGITLLMCIFVPLGLGINRLTALAPKNISEHISHMYPFAHESGNIGASPKVLDS